jgi:acetyl-CoA carboxylase biotin carboxyl carrier protein
MDDIKITIRTTIEGTATETTYVQQMPAHNQQQCLFRMLRQRL